MEGIKMRVTLQNLVSMPLVVFALLAVSCGSYNEGEVAQGVSLEAGTELRVTPVTALSPATEVRGDRFTATLAEPLQSGGEVIAQRGATVVGEVVDVQAGDTPEEESSLSLRLKEITTDNGHNLAIETDPVEYTTPQDRMAEPQPGEPVEPPTIPQGETVVTFRLAESVEVPRVVGRAPTS
jgi:hypothetical protein